MPKVKVPASAGDQIVMSINGGEPTTYKVGDDHTVTVKEADLPQFLANVDGSSVAGGSPTRKGG